MNQDVPVLRLRSLPSARPELTEVPVHAEPFVPAPEFIRRLQRESKGLVEVLVNHEVDGWLIEHREWVPRSRALLTVASHSMCAGSIVGLYMDGRVVPL